MKTFINDNHMHKLSEFSEQASELATTVIKAVYKAADKIVELFTSFNITYIDIQSYDDSFQVFMEDDYRQTATAADIAGMECYAGTLYLYDKDGRDHELCEWERQAPEVLQKLTECLRLKFEDIQKLKVGTRVKWMDPGIEDYDPEDRQEILDRVFVIYDCPETIELDSVIGISEEDGGSEAEVLPMELVVVE